ncbi:MAG: hypothetical protein ACR2OE_01605 [Thermomicrobiales bacterium]
MAVLRKPSPPVVKLKPQTHAKLLEFSKEDDRPMGDIVTFLVDRYEQERFWQGVNADLARLKADPVAWQDYKEELAFFDRAAGDGLESEEPYYTPEEEREILAEVEASRAEGG